MGGAEQLLTRMLAASDVVREFLKCFRDAVVESKPLAALPWLIRALSNLLVPSSLLLACKSNVTNALDTQHKLQATDLDKLEMFNWQIDNRNLPYNSSCKCYK